MSWIEEMHRTAQLPFPPRKRGSRATVGAAALDPRFRGNDDEVWGAR